MANVAAAQGGDPAELQITVDFWRFNAAAAAAQIDGNAAVAVVYYKRCIFQCQAFAIQSFSGAKKGMSWNAI